MYSNIHEVTEDDMDRIVDNNDEDQSPFPPNAERPFRFARSKMWLFGYALATFILGLLSLVACTASFILLPYFQNLHSFQIENKWTTMSLILAGISGFAFLLKQKLVCIVCCITFTTVNGPLCLATFIIHAINANFKLIDHAKYKERGNPSQVQHALTSAGINIAICIFAGIGCILSVFYHRYILTTISRNYGYTHSVEKHRLRLSLLGLSQLIIGLLISAWWIGVQVFFSSENVEHYAIPTAEIFTHGLVISSVGYIQMMATSKGTTVMIITAAVMNGASLSLSTYFTAYPLSVMYFALDHGRSTYQLMIEAKVVLCALLILIYFTLVFLCTYSLVQFLKILFLPNVTELLGERRKVFGIINVLLPLLGFIYAVIEIMAVTMHFMYKFDFTSLPVMVMSAGLLLFIGGRIASPLVLSSSISMLVCACAFSFQEVYLFIYHCAKPHAPDSADHLFMTVGNLAVHAIQLVLAGLILTVCLVTVVLLIKPLSTSLIMAYHPISSKFNRATQLWVSVFECIMAILLFCVGFRTFVEEDLALEDFGDRIIPISIILFAAGAFAVTSRKFQVLIFSAIMLHVQFLTLIWQESDRFTYLVRKHAGRVIDVEGLISTLQLQIQEHSELAARAENATSASLSSTIPAVFTQVTTTTVSIEGLEYQLRKNQALGALEENQGFAMGCILLLVLLITFVLTCIYLFAAGIFLESTRFAKPDTLPAEVEPTMEEVDADQIMIDVSRHKHTGPKLEQNGVISTNGDPMELLVDNRDIENDPELMLELKPEVLVDGIGER